LEFATQIDQDALAKLTCSRVLLFLSVDIENSTKLKRKPTWFGSVAGFLTGFGPAFFATLGAKGTGCKEPVLWKALGDELVFYAEVTKTEEIRAYLLAFKDTVHRNNTDQKPYTPKLKSSAWLAEFPYRNMMMPLAREDSVPVDFDFVGPQMDIGFRLARFATSRRFAVSLELAWVALNADMGLNFFWDGLHPVKGLVERPGYPVLWIDADGSGKQALTDRKFGRHAGDRLALLTHCKQHARQLKHHVRLPHMHAGKIEASKTTLTQMKRVERRYLAVMALTEPPGTEVDAASDHLPDAKAVARERLGVSRVSRSAKVKSRKKPG
jgi:hypothetical protein